MGIGYERSTGKGRAGSAVDVSSLYLYPGDTGWALDWLERGYEVRDPNLPYIGVDL